MQMFKTNQCCSVNRIISTPLTVLLALSSETLVIHSPVSQPPACSKAHFIPPCGPHVAAPSILLLSLKGGQPYRPRKPDGRAANNQEHLNMNVPVSGNNELCCSISKMGNLPCSQRPMCSKTRIASPYGHLTAVSSKNQQFPSESHHHHRLDKLRLGCGDAVSIK